MKENEEWGTDVSGRRDHGCWCAGITMDGVEEREHQQHDVAGMERGQ